MLMLVPNLLKCSRKKPKDGEQPLAFPKMVPIGYLKWDFLLHQYQSLQAVLALIH